MRFRARYSKRRFSLSSVASFPFRFSADRAASRNDLKFDLTFLPPLNQFFFFFFFFLSGDEQRGKTMKVAELTEQYARFPEIDREEVKKLVAWIHAQPHMADLDEAEALHFFHACRYSLETSKQVLDLNLTIRTHCAEFFANRDVERSDLKRAMETVAIAPLPQCTPEGYRVIIARLSDTNASHFNFADSIKLYNMVFDVWLMEDGIRSGHVIVIDLLGCTLGHVARMGVLQMKKFLIYLQEATAIRLKGFHFVNTVPFMDKILALMNPFMKRELLSILHLHHSLEDFFRFVPQAMLPKDYGGPEPDLDHLKDIFYKKLRDGRAEMMAFEKSHQIDEKLRPGKSKSASDLFGVEGNFKRLDID